MTAAEESDDINIDNIIETLSRVWRLQHTYLTPDPTSSLRRSPEPDLFIKDQVIVRPLIVRGKGYVQVWLDF